MWASRCDTSMPASIARSIWARHSASTASGCALARTSATVDQQYPSFVGQPTRRGRAADRRPPVTLLLRVEGEVNADVERVVAGRDRRDLGEPRARHHDRAGADGAESGELDEGLIRAVAHPDIVGVDHHPGHGFDRTAPAVGR